MSAYKKMMAGIISYEEYSQVMAEEDRMDRAIEEMEHKDEDYEPPYYTKEDFWRGV